MHQPGYDYAYYQEKQAVEEYRQELKKASAEGKLDEVTRKEIGERLDSKLIKIKKDSKS